MKSRRHFLLQLPASATVGKLLAEAESSRSRLGIGSIL